MNGELSRKLTTKEMTMQEYRPPHPDFPNVQEFYDAEFESRMSEVMDERIAEAESKGYTLVKRRKIGRNDPCPCNSGKKFKTCCIDKVRR